MMFYFLARAYLQVGRSADAEEPLRMAIEQAEKSGEKWFLAELYRLHGELLLASEAATEIQPEAVFQQALALARQQRARAWELRTAMSLARLWQQQGYAKRALKLLKSVYAQFDEGFTTADLLEARQLLAGLHE
jgi:predicted ATPase